MSTPPRTFGATPIEKFGNSEFPRFSLKTPGLLFSLDVQRTDVWKQQRSQSLPDWSSSVTIWLPAMRRQFTFHHCCLSFGGFSVTKQPNAEETVISLLKCALNHWHWVGTKNAAEKAAPAVRSRLWKLIYFHHFSSGWWLCCDFL